MCENLEVYKNVQITGLVFPPNKIHFHSSAFNLFLKQIFLTFNSFKDSTRGNAEESEFLVCM